ncbi:MAG: recombinase family protein [Frankiaceae bacterium]|nr:recombinase family protein [Frankiaceae bacterium]
MTKFAFYGRVSTEDQQDPASSRGWQLSRSTALITPHDGQVVAEYFDIGLSRSLPWKRRPEAARLLQDLARPNRGFDAVVIGEPARAFYGNQFGLTFPVFVHYGVQLWVPEVGGAVDPGSDAHDLVMSLYGGMSKGERNRIKIRVRSAMAAQAATEGRFLGGRPPYGYRLADAGPHPNPGKAAIGQRLHALEPDPVTASAVARIFAEYLRGQGIWAIAEGLTADGVPSPSGHDPARNRHRIGIAWSKGAVRAILLNPRYTGRQVWNKQRKEEILLDVEDVAAGHETKMRWNTKDDWIWSQGVVHQPLVEDEVFQQVQALFAARGRTPTERKNRPAVRPYALRGLMTCGLCGRKMESLWANERAHYRCRYPREYAASRALDHPKNVILREDLVLPTLDRWLASLFDEEHRDATIDAMAQHQANPVEDARVEAARRRIEDCNKRLAKYRAALEAGMDAALVAQWTAEVEFERRAAEIEQQPAPVPTHRLSRDEIAGIVDGLRSAYALLRRADSASKTAVYKELGLRLTFQPSQKLLLASVTPGIGISSCPRGDLNPHSP